MSSKSYQVQNWKKPPRIIYGGVDCIRGLLVCVWFYMGKSVFSVS